MNTKAISTPLSVLRFLHIDRMTILFVWIVSATGILGMSLRRLLPTSLVYANFLELRRSGMTNSNNLDEIISLEQYTINVVVQIILIRKLIERIHRDGTDI